MIKIQKYFLHLQQAVFNITLSAWLYFQNGIVALWKHKSSWPACVMV